MPDSMPAIESGSPPTPPESCRTCSGTRYCAPLRCYCGHAACPAVASYVDMTLVPVADGPKGRASSAWANREGATWIDKL